MDIRNKSERMKSKSYMGNNYQVGGTRHYRLCGGKADGTRCIDVKTGSGFEYTVVCDRGMDISLASFAGTNLVYLTQNMESHPSFYDPAGDEWLKTFSGGLLTTCGPTNIGNPCEDAGESLGQHGVWSALPAYQVCDLTDYEEGTIEIRGKLFDGETFGHQIAIDRRITSEFGKSYVVIDDVIRNEGGAKVPLNVLYHINFGFPFLDETVEIHIPSTKCVGYDAYSTERISENTRMQPPSGDSVEKNYLHSFEGKEKVTAWVHNKNIGDGLLVYITFDPKLLPYVTQWIYENVREYVLAIEPANVPCMTRKELREKNMLPMINPGESVQFKVEIGVVSGKEKIETFLEEQK